MGMMSTWKPVVYRGDGAWIGRMASGELGVGTENEERASLKAAGVRPMWPFLEKGMMECCDQFKARWDELRSPDFPTLDALISATIETAWRSGSRYWMLLSVNWLAEVGRTAVAEHSLLAEVRIEMLASEIVEEGLRSSIR